MKCPLIKRKIGKLERILAVAEQAKDEEDIDEKTILDSLRQLGRLRKSLAELEQKKAQAVATEEDLQDIAKRLTSASDSWDSLPYDRQRMLVQLIVKKATLTPINGRWMQLDIEWTSFMGFNFVDRGYIFNLRGQAGAWNQEDRELLATLYPTVDRDTILKTFPSRTWSSINNQVSKHMEGIARPKTLYNNSSLPRWMSYEDKAIIDKYNVNLGEYYKDEPEKNCAWFVLACQDSDLGQCVDVRVVPTRAVVQS